jgi:hypothetical protein
MDNIDKSSQVPRLLIVFGINCFYLFFFFYCNGNALASAVVVPDANDGNALAAAIFSDATAHDVSLAASTSTSSSTTSSPSSNDIILQNGFNITYAFEDIHNIMYVFVA